MMGWLSKSQITRTVELLRVIGLHTRVNVEANEILHFTYVLIFDNKAAPNDLKGGAQCWLSTFVTTLLRSKYLVKRVFQLAFYFCPSLSVFSTRLTNSAATNIPH